MAFQEWPVFSDIDRISIVAFRNHWNCRDLRLVGAAAEFVVAGSAFEQVIARAAVEQIIEQAADQVVVPLLAEELGVPGEGGTVVEDDLVIATAGEDPDGLTVPVADDGSLAVD